LFEFKHFGILSIGRESLVEKQNDPQLTFLSVYSFFDLALLGNVESDWEINSKS